MANYSSLYNYHRCYGCPMHTGANKCSALCADGYMLNCDTGEIIDTAIPVFDYNDGAVPMCERCAWYVAEECENDGEYHADYIQTEDTSRYYSREYAENNLYQCEDCGAWFEYDDYITYTDGGAYCRECRGAHSLIQPYHNHHGEYSPIGGTWSDDLIGLEVESDGYGCGDECDCAQALDGIFDGAVVFEEDCSLYSGFETITQPHTLEAMRDFDFDALTTTMLDCGASENPSSAGFHMHFSRSWFGDTPQEIRETVGRLMRSYSDNWRALVDLSCRGDVASIEQYAQPLRIACDDETPEDTYWNNCGVWYNRYNAINCENSKTIEFRLGAAYLNPRYMRKWIELHVQMIEAARAGVAFTVNYDYTISLQEAGTAAA